jgi:hypothetical protein
MQGDVLSILLQGAQNWVPVGLPDYVEITSWAIDVCPARWMLTKC